MDRLNNSFIILDTSVAGKDLKTAKYNTNDIEEAANDILFWLNLLVNSVSMHSIGSLAILNDLPGKRHITLMSTITTIFMDVFIAP
jgi:hypothetical protein